ncbi:sporulation kinase [Jeotgalibacillus malaysiensis]|uniref:histidine kinase n=1 Tax=Jeotgalibacillus malaysiensis TaxID=1508404 RepID=A0A0B5AUN9_9BACL|nr:ATP-binding protein [Jeotgalibacillus malaysiensis]AJD92437.1 sporulation kinase [Jeotgalibacillus malaysiensis]
MLQSYTFSQIRVLIGIIGLVFIVQIIFIFAGFNGWFSTATYIVIEVAVAIILLWLAFMIYRRATALRSLFKDMEEEEFKMSAMIQSMPDFVCFKDGNGRWIRTNDFGLELYGLKGKHYIGKTDAELGDINPFFKEAFDYCVVTDEQTWQKGETDRSEESFYVESGEYKSFDVIKVPIFHKDGSRKALITIGRDISQQKAAEEQLLRREKLSVAGEMASGIAHEIKNPLTSLKGYVQLMQETGSLTEERVNLMASEIDRIHAITEELLILSKPEIKKHEQFSICDSVDYVINFMKHQAASKKIDIKVSRLDHEDKFVYGDRNQIVQVFMNLVKNSIEAIEENGEILIKPSVQGDEIQIELRDSGPGIPEELIEKVSEAFYTTKEKGMGLGLTVCHRIVHAHGGSLVFENLPEGGTNAIVQLPLYSTKKTFTTS